MVAGKCNSFRCVRCLHHLAPVRRFRSTGLRKPYLSMTRALSGQSDLDADGTKLTETGQGYVSFEFGEGMEFFVSQLPDGRFNMKEVFMTGGEATHTGEEARIRPAITGDIETAPAFYQTIPCETFMSGDVMNNVEEQHILEHVVFVRIGCRDPHSLDFRSVYCFNCKKKEFYRVEPIALHPDTIEEPILRFQVQEDRFLLDSQQTCPDPVTVNEKYEARELGLDIGVDAHADAVIARMEEEAKAKDTRGEEGDGEVVETIVGDDETDDMKAGDEDESLEEGIDDEGGGYDTPDVPAVDLA